MNKIDTMLRECCGRVITREDFDSIANKYKFKSNTLRKVMLNKGYLITIFRGVYYLKSHEEKKFNSIKYSSYELLSVGLKKKGVKWYFGLNTALKFLNLVHEIFPVNIIINDKFNRMTPMKIMGSSFLFIKLKPKLFFDIKKITTDNKIDLYYSDIEKTLLDMIYLKRGINLSEYDFNKFLLLKGATKYNRIVKNKLKELENGNK